MNPEQPPRKRSQGHRTTGSRCQVRIILQRNDFLQPSFLHFIQSANQKLLKLSSFFTSIKEMKTFPLFI
jgi:hypothetical protein